MNCNHTYLNKIRQGEDYSEYKCRRWQTKVFPKTIYDDILYIARIKRIAYKEIVRDLEVLRIDYGFDTEYLISNYEKGSREYKEFLKKWGIE